MVRDVHLVELTDEDKGSSGDWSDDIAAGVMFSAGLDRGGHKARQGGCEASRARLGAVRSRRRRGPSLESLGAPR